MDTATIGSGLGENPLQLMSYRVDDTTVVFKCYKSTISARPISDSSKRAVKGVEFTLQVEALVTPLGGQSAGAQSGTNSTDIIMTTLRQVLTKKGGTLTFTSKGYGDLIVNEGDVWDSEFGPHPQLLDWNPVGSAMAALIKWQVKTTIPQCADAKFTDAISEMNYVCSHEIDRDGYAVIHVDGHIEIPMTRRGNTTPDHVDAFRGKIQTPVPLGFQRMNAKFDISEDKRQLKFSWQDVQVREPLPNGITHLPLKHRVQKVGRGFVQYKHTISGEIVASPNVSKDYMFVVAWGVIFNRWEAAIAGKASHGIGDSTQGPIGGIVNIGIGPPDPTIAARRALIPLDVSVENDIGGRSMNISFSFLQTVRSNLPGVIQQMGVFEPFRGQRNSTTTDWQAWRESLLKLYVTSVRGPARVFWGADHDAIIDLCGTEPLPTPQPNVPQPSPRPPFNIIAPPGEFPGQQPVPPIPTLTIIDDPVDTKGPGPDGSVANSPKGDPIATLPGSEETWLSYDMELVYNESPGRYARHRPLGRKATSQGSLDAAGPFTKFFTAPGPAGSVQASVPDTLQDCGPPSATVFLVGSATRIGSKIPLPNLLAVRGCVAKLNRVVESRQQVRPWGDLLIYRQSWIIEFLLDQPPRQPLPRLADPMLRVNGG